MHARWIATLVLLAGCASRPRPLTSGMGAPLPQAASFDTRELPAPVRGNALSGALAERFAQATRAAQLEPDGRLAELALAVAEGSESASQPPSYPVVTYHAHRVGLAEPTPQVWLASGPSTESLLPALERAIADSVRTSRLTHAGAAAVEVQGGVVMALALSNRAFSLQQPIPRQSARGQAIQLVARLAHGYGAPTIAVTDPAGRVSREPLGAEAHLQYTLHPRGVGEYTLELLASGPEGLTVVAIVPVMVGGELATHAPVLERAPVERDAQAVVEHLLRAIQDERKQRKLPPLMVDPALTAIALAHSQDMVEHGFIAHTSRRTGDATARIRSAGLEARLVLENIGRGYSAAELHRGLMESPGHRGNILHPDARQIGIGVVAEREGDRDAFIATELFTQRDE